MDNPNLSWLLHYCKRRDLEVVPVPSLSNLIRDLLHPPEPLFLPEKLLDLGEVVLKRGIVICLLVTAV